MEIKILIIEDEMLVAEDLAEFFKGCGFTVSGIAASGEECFASINKTMPDIVILDIHLKGKMDGIEIAQLISKSYRIPFIYLSAHSESDNTDRLIPTNPCAFISKPFNKNDLRIAIELACQKNNSHAIQTTAKQEDSDDRHIFIKSGGTFKRIDIKTILYIEAKGSYSEIVTSERAYTLSYNLNYFASKISDPLFKKVHRSFVININKVDGFDRSSLIINKTTIPVSKQHQKEIKAYFMKL